MNHRAATAALLLFALTTASARAAEGDPQPVTTRISAVTVFPDRAQITRIGTVELGAQGSRVVISQLPGWIDEESVRAAIVPASAGRIVDVAVTRTFLSEASEETVRKAEAAVREITDQLESISDEERVLTVEITQVEAIRAFAIDKLPKDMQTRDIKIKTFGETIDFVGAKVRANREALRVLAKKRRDLQPTLAARTKAKEELQARSQLEQANVVIDVSGNGRATLELTYLTPGATWEPASEIRAEGERKVEVTQYAAIVQTTGEDWEGATLSFSTQRPNDVLNVPQAQALLLGAGAGLGDVMTRMGESFNRASSSYSTQNMLLGNQKKGWQQQIANQMEVQSRAAQAFAKLQERGTTARFTAISSRTVRADGKTVRVPIAVGNFDVALRQVAVPEASLNVVRTAELVNTGSQAILPGRAALFADGSFVGSSELGFVAPGEKFSVFLGVNERVKIARSIDRKRSSLERKGKKTKVSVSFLLTAENLGSEPVTLQLGDRFPVAQDKEIEVDDIRIPEGAKREASGVFRWTATVAPKKTVSWRVEYTLEYPSNYLQRPPPPEAEPADMNFEENAPASPAPARRVYDDIQKLEKNF